MWIERRSWAKKKQRKRRQQHRKQRIWFCFLHPQKMQWKGPWWFCLPADFLWPKVCSPLLLQFGCSALVILNDTSGQICFSTEDGPDIPKMEMHLLAHPWRRVLLKMDMWDPGWAFFRGKAHHNEWFICSRDTFKQELTQTQTAIST